MELAIGADASGPLPMRRLMAPKALAWPVCGRVVDVSGGPDGHAVRCHLSHGHRGECDELGSAELAHWQAISAPVLPPAPDLEPQGPAPQDAGAIAAAHARSYEAMAHWKRERGWRVEADRLDAMADALRRLVQVLAR